MTTDGGNTWSDRNVLFSGGATGMVHNLMMAYADGIFYSFWNIQYRQLWCSRSKDGLTWEEPRDLTRMLWRAGIRIPVERIWNRIRALRAAVKWQNPDSDLVYNRGRWAQTLRVCQYLFRRRVPDGTDRGDAAEPSGNTHRQSQRGSNRGIRQRQRLGHSPP